MSKKYVIVGGVAGGASAATRLRRLEADAEIVLIERSPYVSFANCGLPYYLGGAIENRSQLLVQTPQSMQTRFRIDVRVESEVVSVDAARHVVRIRHDGKEYEGVFEDRRLKGVFGGMRFKGFTLDGQKIERGLNRFRS